MHDAATRPRRGFLSLADSILSPTSDSDCIGRATLAYVYCSAHMTATDDPSDQTRNVSSVEGAGTTSIVESILR
jgi:hypothetical protein